MDPPLLGEGTSPFIDEGDGLTQERVRMLLSCCPRRQVQDDGMRPQHCYCQTHVEGFTVFAWYGSFEGTHNSLGQMSAFTTLLGF